MLLNWLSLVIFILKIYEKFCIFLIRFYFALLNLIPAAFIVCIIVTIFASLNFKVKDASISKSDIDKIDSLYEDFKNNS